MTIEPVDYMNIPVEVGDRVLFPAGREMMEGFVTKLGRRQCSVKNDNGYIKQKDYNVILCIGKIRNKLPEYQL